MIQRLKKKKLCPERVLHDGVINLLVCFLLSVTKFLPGNVCALCIHIYVTILNTLDAFP